jgi:hypothetical protein
MGFKGPLVLGYPETQREILLPVPPGVPLANATLQVDASFVRADGGRTTLILSLDVSARPVSSERGDGSLTLAVDGAPRTNGLVLGALQHRLAYRDRPREYLHRFAHARESAADRAVHPVHLSLRWLAVQDLSAAWASLPSSPLILIAGNKLSTDAYDSAWRLGVALEHAGKRPRIKALPSVGDVVDLQGVVVPTALRRIPAFAVLADGGKRRIKDVAEIGALMALGQGGPLPADIVIGDRGTGWRPTAGASASPRRSRDTC